MSNASCCWPRCGLFRTFDVRGKVLRTFFRDDPRRRERPQLEPVIGEGPTLSPAIPSRAPGDHHHHVLAAVCSEVVVQLRRRPRTISEGNEVVGLGGAGT
jgi:hypothetical protein